MNTPRALTLARLAVVCAAALLAACGGSDPGYCTMIGPDLATGQPAQVIEVDPSTFVGPLLPCDDPRLYAR